MSEEKPNVILAEEAKVGASYLSRGGREVTVQSIEKTYVRVKVAITGTSVPIPKDYPLSNIKPGTVIPVAQEETKVEVKEAVQDKPIEEPEEPTIVIPKAPPIVEEDAIAPEEPEEVIPVVKAPTKTIKENILDLLLEGNQYSVEELAKLTNAATTTVRLKLSEIGRSGAVKLVNENKKYRIDRE